MNIPTLTRSISHIRLLDNVKSFGLCDTSYPIFNWKLYRNNDLFLEKGKSSCYAKQKGNIIQFKYLIRNNSALLFNYTHTKSNLAGLLFFFKICDIYTPFLIPKDKTIQIARGIEFSKPIFVYEDFSFNSGDSNHVSVYTNGNFNPTVIPIVQNVYSKIDMNSIKFDLYNYLLQSNV